jgi:hypothetical protein
MVKEFLEGSAKWFKAKMGLYDQWLHIRKEIIDAHASIEDCEVVFGKIKGSNGFRYDVCKDTKFVARVQSLYVIVYQKLKITNNTIGVNFAKAILLRKKG